MLVEKSPLGAHGVEYHPMGTIEFSLTRVVEDEHTSGLLTVKGFLADGSKMHIYTGRLSLSSAQSRKNVANYIKNVVAGSPFENVDWVKLIERFSNDVFTLLHSPNEAKALELSETPPTVEYLLYPLLPARVPALIYAPGGAGKSIVALYIATLLQSGYDLNYRQQEPVNVLYVDWELDYRLTNTRFNQLVIDIDEKRPPLYLPAIRPLWDEIYNIVENITKHKIKLVILDSAALASGGDLIDSANVIRFFGEVRKLTDMGVTVLIISHVSKAHKEKDDGAMPIGSVFFENLARMTWELKFWRSPTDEKTFIYALYNRKSNFGYHEPLGLKVLWQDGFAFISRADAELKTNVTGNTVRDVVYSLLLEEGEMSPADLAKLIGASQQVIWNALSELKKQGLAENVSRGKWRAIHA